MLIVMQPEATEEDVARVVAQIEAMGLSAHPIPGAGRTAVGITGNKGAVAAEAFECLPNVSQAVAISQPFKLVSREVKPERTVIDVRGACIGGDRVALMAGPCAVESEAQLMACAESAAASGAQFLRGGAFKPRTSPYDFQGLKEDGLKLLAKARDATGLRVVTEVLNTETVPMVAHYADILQVGARNMQNFSLLEALGEQRKPVMLKRGLCATIKEWLMAAEYIVARGNYDVMLCERGIRTYETTTRNTLDLSAVAVLHTLTHLPVVVDPSHGTGRRDAVAPMALAAIAAGADGLLIEMHPQPERALSDGPQSLTLPMFAQLTTRLRQVAQAVGREV